MIVAGLDLAAKPERCSGYAAIDLGELAVKEVGCLGDNESIINAVRNARVVAVDAPLTLPKRGGFREVDRLLIKVGGRVLPLTLRGMAMLTRRGINLAKNLERLGVKVIETHPRSALVVSGCSTLQEVFDVLGIKVFEPYRPLLDTKRDLRDAAIAAVVAACYLRGCATRIKAVDGEIWILKKLCSEQRRKTAEVRGSNPRGLTKYLV